MYELPSVLCREAVSTFTNRLIQRLTQMLNVARQLGDNTEAVSTICILLYHSYDVLYHLADLGIRRNTGSYGDPL